MKLKNILITHLLSLSVISTPLFAASTNACITDIASHITSTSNGAITFYTLHLSSCNLQDSDMTDVVTYLNSHPEISELMLSSNQIGDVGATTLSSLQTIKFLGLGYNTIGAQGAAALAKMPVTYLTIYNNQLNDAGIQALATSSIPLLEVDANNVSSVGAAALAQDNQLLYVDLDDNPNIGDSGAKSLASSISLQNVTLVDDQISDEGGMALGGDNHLVELALMGNSIGIDTVKMLATNKNLKFLSMSDLSDDEAIALSTSSSLMYLITGNRNVQLTDTGAIAIASIPNLISVSLRGNKIGDKGAIAFANKPSLDELDLSYNQVGDKGAAAIAKYSFATTVDLSGNKVNDTSMLYFATNITIKNLTLAYNNITDIGATFLANNHMLRILDVSYNQIGTAGISLLNQCSWLNWLFTTGNPGNPGAMQNTLVTKNINKKEAAAKHHALQRKLAMQLISKKFSSTMSSGEDKAVRK